MPDAMKIVIDPTSRIFYASYYIKGFYEVFGKKNISFSKKPFEDLKRDAKDFSFEHNFAFILLTPNGNKLKFIIDFCDPPDIHKHAYDWSDHYAKINVDFQLTPKPSYNKLIAIPPGFGIKIWNKWETLYYCFLNLIKCRFAPLVTFKRYFQDYYLQYRRLTLNDYLNVNSNFHQQKPGAPYIFMISTLWEDHGPLAGTNSKRKKFIEVCNSLKCNFEGGFFASEDHSKFEEYKDYIFTSTYSHKSYVEKTAKSEIVFNTPAVHNCHGWKLAEYFALGKAIISTPLSNETPKGIIHGKNIHIVENMEALNFAVSLLLNDQDYRFQLGQKAMAYYHKHASPSAVISSIIQSAKLETTEKAV